MDLNDITPLVLTYNEERNIERCLENLRWAKRVVVLDSQSTDRTVSLARRFPNVAVFSRKFDLHATQWAFGIQETQISTGWVLALDCDYVVFPEALAELRSRNFSEEVSAVEVAFDYYVYGRKLRGGIYPPVKVLFRPSRCRMGQDGHTHKLKVLEGKVERLASHFGHDDWKPLSHWLVSQSKYHDLELAKLTQSESSELGTADRVRKKIYFAPFLVFAHCLFFRGGIFGGKAAIGYAFQRLVSELILSLKLIERDLGKKDVSVVNSDTAKAS